MEGLYKILLFIVLFANFSFGQKSEETKLFAMIYTPGEKWDHEISFNQQPFFAEHSKHIQSLRKEGIIVVGGRYSDKGFMLLRSKDIIEARGIVQKDASVTHQIFHVDLFEFSTFYEGCVGSVVK